MKSITLSAAALALTVGVAGQATADDIKISSWAPPTHPVNSQLFPTWGKCIQDATKGAVTWKIEYNLAPPPAQFDVVRKGIGDVAWIFHGYNAGRYVATKIVELPGLGTNATAAAVAYWRTHEKYLDKLNEHRGVRLVGLMTHGPGVLQTNKDITSLNQLKGMKLRLPGGVATDVFSNFGVVPVNVPAPKVYEVLSTGVADGVVMPIETQKSFKLHEVVKNVVVMPGGFYYGSFAIIMNPRRYASLSKAHQAAVDKCSGENLSKIAGAAWDGADAAGTKQAETTGKLTVASEAMQKEFAPVAKKVTDEWIAAVKKKGLANPQEALDYLREQAKSYK